MRFLVLVPRLRRRQVETSARLQHTADFTDHLKRIIDMFQGLHANSGIKTVLRKWQFAQDADRIQARVIPPLIAHGTIQANVARMIKVIIIPSLPAAGIQYQCPIRHLFARLLQQTL